MHELAICQALITQVRDIAHRREAHVRQVRIGIGPLCGVEARLLADAYPLACAGTLAEGSRLEIETTVPRVRCRTCGSESVVAANRLLCGACGDWQTDLLAGDEMLLLSVELELPDSMNEGPHV